MARFENGYIKFHRKAFFGDIGSNIHCLGLWVALLSMATWKESKIIVCGKQRVIPPGTVVVGLRDLAEMLSCSKDTITRWLRYLTDTRRIDVEIAPRGTIVTILNWETYQSSEDDAETQIGRKSDADRTLAGHDTPPLVGRQPTLSEEVKKVRKKKEELKALAVASADENSLIPIENEITTSVSAKPPAPQLGTQTFVGKYVQAFQKRYGSEGRPYLGGKVQGQIKRFLADTPLERAVNLIEVYFQMDDPWFKTKSHDFTTFLENQNKIGLALDTGQAAPGDGINWDNVFGKNWKEGKA